VDADAGKKGADCLKLTFFITSSLTVGVLSMNSMPFNLEALLKVGIYCCNLRLRCPGNGYTDFLCFIVNFFYFWSEDKCLGDLFNFLKNCLRLFLCSDCSSS